jgi:hypothetical protein
MNISSRVYKSTFFWTLICEFLSMILSCSHYEYIRMWMLTDNSGLLGCYCVSWANTSRSFEGSWWLPLFTVTVRLFDSVYEVTTTFAMVRYHLSKNTPPHPRRREASATLLREPQIFNVHWSQILTHRISTSPSMFTLALIFYLHCTWTMPSPAACRGTQHFRCFHKIHRKFHLFLLSFARLITGFTYCVILCLNYADGISSSAQNSEGVT